MAKEKTRSSGERVFLVVVDETEELHVALRYAARRAMATGGRVALFYVIEPSGFGHWIAVEDLMEKEMRLQAEETLKKHSDTVMGMTGQIPALYIREGNRLDALLDLLGQRPPDVPDRSEGVRMPSAPPPRPRTGRRRA